MLFKTIWNVWKWLALKIGRFNSRIILTILYFILVGPFALTRNLILWMGKKRLSKDSFWEDYPPIDHTINGIKQQY